MMPYPSVLATHCQQQVCLELNRNVFDFSCQTRKAFEITAFE